MEVKCKVCDIKSTYNRRDIDIKNYICGECLWIYQRVKEIKTSKDIKDIQTATVVFATEPSKHSNLPKNPWIEGVYLDSRDAFDRICQMENSEDYRHLCWSNNILTINK